MKWPMAPLLALARTRDGERMPLSDLSALSGIPSTNFSAWKRRGIPTDEQAERLAVALGFDPANVWGDEWTQAQIAAVSVACEECRESFVPSRKGVRFCCHKCRDRNGARRRYWNTPGKREKEIARSAARYAETAEYEKRMARLRAAADPERERARKRAYYWRTREVRIAYMREYRRSLKDRDAA